MCENKSNKEDFWDLYKHEDNLNWIKLNNLIISIIAIGAGIGVLYTTENSNIEIIKETIKILFILGGIVIISFTIALWSGVENVIYWRIKAEGEEGNNSKNGISIFLCKVCKFVLLCDGWYFNSNNRRRFNTYFGNNPTTRWVLRIAPLLILAVWIWSFNSYQKNSGNLIKSKEETKPIEHIEIKN